MGLSSKLRFGVAVQTTQRKKNSNHHITDTRNYELRIIAVASWTMIELFSKFQQLFWFKMPISYDISRKQFHPNALKSTWPWHIILAFQIPLMLCVAFHLFRELLVPVDCRSPQFTFLVGTVFVAGLTLDAGVTWIGFVMTWNCDEICSCLNVACDRFWKLKRVLKGFSPKGWTSILICGNLTVFYLFVYSFVIISLIVPFTGFVSPLVQKVDPIYYTFQQNTLFFQAVRSLTFGLWAYLCCFNIFFMVLYSVVCILFICGSFSESFSEDLFIGHHEHIAFQYAFQTFQHLRLYIQRCKFITSHMSPLAVLMIFFYGVECGYLTVKGRHLLSWNTYLVFPVNLNNMIILLHVVFPLCSRVYDDSNLFKRYWLVRVYSNKIERRMLASCRNLRLSIGQFGFCKKSVTLRLTEELMSYIGTAVISIKV